MGLQGEKQFYNDRLIRKGLTNGFDEEVSLDEINRLNNFSSGSRIQFQWTFSYSILFSHTILFNLSE